MSIFLLKIHLHQIGFIHSNGLTKVDTWLVDMESISDFIVLSYFLKSILDID